LPGSLLLHYDCAGYWNAWKNIGKDLNRYQTEYPSEADIMYSSEGQIIGLVKYKRKVEALQAILPKLCPTCKKMVEEALAHR